MLWYKAWVETRARFLISLAGIVALCSYSVYHANEESPSYRAPEVFYAALHYSHELLAFTWVVAITLLAMGGLLREKAIGSASFSLALPVSRTRLMAARISVGMAQGMVLVIFPWFCMFLIASLAGKAPPIAQAGFHIVLLASGGLLFFAIALLVSSIVEGEYTAPMLSYAIVIAIAFGLGDPARRAYSPIAFIVGSEYLNKRQGLLKWPIPWNNVAVYLLLATLLTVISVKVVRGRDFS